MGSEVESTLFVHKEVDLFKIPPRMGASGHRSGEWKMADKVGGRDYTGAAGAL